MKKQYKYGIFIVMCCPSFHSLAEAFGSISYQRISDKQEIELREREFDVQISGSKTYHYSWR